MIWYPVLWVIYDHPKDIPLWWVARLWENGAPTKEHLLGNDLEFLRTRLRARGLVMIPRDPSDDPVIVEMWI